MHLSSDVQIPDGLLAANALLAENSRQGSVTYSGTLHQGFGFVISHTSLRIIGPLYDGDVRSRCTGKERDTESGLDYFGARYYGSSMGRFMSPDDGSDQDPSDPQSWNLYGYVRNNPLSNTDPDGHDCVTQMATQGGGETASVTTGQCTGASGNGTTQTYIAGTVTSLAYAADGKSLNVGYNAYGSDSNTSASVASLDRAPAPDNPGIALGYNQAGYAQLANTSRVMNYIGGIATATWGMIPLGDAGALTSLGGLAGKVRIIEQDGNAIRAVVQTAKGPVTIMANVVKQGDQLVLSGVHVDGVGLSVSEIRQAASALGKQEGVGEVVIQGGVRTSGANPGSTPTQIRVKVK